MATLEGSEVKRGQRFLRLRPKTPPVQEQNRVLLTEDNAPLQNEDGSYMELEA